jgi:very-short-patch-repair endonuclease
MVLDLEGAQQAMIAHDLVAALAGDPEAQAVVRERHTSVQLSSPDYTPPADEFLVLDADASQNYAVNSVLGGQDLVIKGPPGNGKSQTITNLISTLVARGKKVLFVAEKRAAIDAVLRRLEAAGLADLVLDLHGKAASKRVIAQSLGQALESSGRIARQEFGDDHRMLEARREELNAHVKALHTKRAPWDISYFDVQSRLQASNASCTSESRLRGTVLDALYSNQYHVVRENIRTFGRYGGFTLGASGSPWANARVTSSDEAQRVQQILDHLRRHTLPQVLSALQAAADSTGIRDSRNIRSWSAALGAWEGAAKTCESFQPAAYDLRIEDLLPVLTPLSRGAFSRAIAWATSSEYRKARAAVSATLQQGQDIPPRELYKKLEVIDLEHKQWTVLSTRQGNPAPPSDLPTLRASYEQMVAELAELDRYLDDYSDLDEASLLIQLDRLLADNQHLSVLPELHRLRVELCSCGLQEFVSEMEHRTMSNDAAAACFEYLWLKSVSERIEIEDGRIANFDSRHHSRAVSEFQLRDRQHIGTTGRRVRRLAAEQATRALDEFPEQAALIRDQAARKRKHLSVRTLFANAPDVMTALKPCWAMSPLLVSQLLPADRQYFDVVVFDEASQVRPADAIPAIVRGKRLVVAGDERQLPPTTFFAGSDPQVETRDFDGRVVVDEGYESILEALLPFINFRVLTWHYRSRDEKLISFANTYIYDRSLTTFPGVVGDDCIQHVLVPFEYGQNGSELSSRAEVEEVVRLIFEHAEKRPDESLGVITMGIKHADRIGEALRLARPGRPDLDDFFTESRPERFFVKNLERVQGDERDAIILTIGYGKNADGRLLYRFGPLNEKNGERRLNVAVTRAKRRMTVVSSFSHEDMDPSRSSNVGVEHLRLYLQYAASRGRDLGAESLSIPELNPFEIDIRDALSRAGIPLVPQFGCSGYRIDFAAKHPARLGQMVLAIECDGASYHSSDTARDRDRLRQEHLERLGWKFHRIWSQDWFANKEVETAKVLSSYQGAVAASDAMREPANDAHEFDRRSKESEQASPVRSDAPARISRPAVSAGRKINEYSEAELRLVIRWIMSDTLLRTRDQLLGEAMEALGFRIRGKRIVDTISRAIALEMER